ncbi:MAG: Uma2 family endonuclease [Lachnospiraceae bacterium]|nr:Uma2 family endonuclease [Lachnospiraceae bacterium]
MPTDTKTGKNGTIIIKKDVEEKLEKTAENISEETTEKTTGNTSEKKSKKEAGNIPAKKTEKTTEKTIEKDSEKSADGKSTGYMFEETAPVMISEALAEYAVSKRLGEYTLEDYLALPEDQRVELIDGVIYDMAAPTLIHQAIGDRLQSSFNDYIRKKRGSCMAFTSPVDVQLDCDDKTIVQPDVLIICDPSKLRRERVYGAPDLVVEVLSPGSSKKDRVLKLTKYKKAGVREYWIIDPDRKRVFVYEFEKGDGGKIYSFGDKVPVGIYNGDCVVDFTQVYEEIRFLYEIM